MRRLALGLAGGAPKRVSAPEPAPGTREWREFIINNLESNAWDSISVESESSSERESMSSNTTAPIGFVPSRTRSGAIYNRP